MSETIKNTEQQKIADAIVLAQDPITALKEMKDTQDKNPFVALVDCRTTLNQYLSHTPNAGVPHADPEFIIFYKASNGAAAFYEAAVSLLRRAGYTRDETGKVFEAFVRAQDNPDNSEMVEKLVTLINHALTVTYGNRGA